MVERRDHYEEKLELLVMEAIAETDTTLGPGRRHEPVHWRMSREGFLRRLCPWPDGVGVLRVFLGDETIGIKLRPIYDRLIRTMPSDRDDGGGTMHSVPQGQAAAVPAPSTVSGDGEANARLSDDQGARASSSSDTTTTWAPEAPPHSKPRPISARRLEIERRIWGGFTIEDGKRLINVRDVAIHRLKHLEVRYGRDAIRAVIQYNVVHPLRDYVERQASVPPHALVRDIVPEEEGDKIVADARQRAAGFLFMVPKGMRIPVALHDD